MARSFGSYSPAVPLGVTWEETLVLEDADGTPIDLTGYAVHAQLRAVVPGRASGVATTDPVLELTSADFYATPPSWPVVEGLEIATPANGTITLSVATADLWTASPDNAKRKLYWSIVLVNPDTTYAIPVVQGKVSFLPARTL